MSKRKPVLGETLFDLNVGNAARHAPQVLTPVVVTRVGKKYFTCAKGGSTSKYDQRWFHLDDWVEKTEYCKNHKLYETSQEWEDGREAKAIGDELRQVFISSSLPPLNVLKMIKSLVDASNHAPSDHKDGNHTFGCSACTLWYHTQEEASDCCSDDFCD